MSVLLALYGSFVVLYGVFVAHTIICHYRYFMPWCRAWEQARRKGDQERMWHCMQPPTCNSWPTK